MKKYILLSHSIAGIGGGQIYARNKINYMRSVGYDSYVISFFWGKVLIDDVKKYEKYVIKEFSIVPFIFSKKRIEKVIDKFIKYVGKIDENTIIESNTYPEIFWGEIIAKKYSCRHFIYNIVEKLPNINDYEREYFKFKRDRNELNGVKNETYRMIFNCYPDETNYNYCLPLVCTNVVEDCNDERFDDIDYSDLNVATIGRLDKDYVPTVIDEIIKFASNHKKIKITYVMIGASQKNKTYKEIKKRFKKSKNTKIYLMGGVYPIPLNFLKKIDVFISSAGSVRVSANIGKPTIAIDARDYHSIGIFNYNTNNAVFRTNEPKVSISDEIEYLYSKNFYKKIKIKKSENIESRIDEILSTHLDHYKKVKNKYEYYDFSNYKLTLKKKVGKMIVTLFGVKIFKKVQEKMSR